MEHWQTSCGGPALSWSTGRIVVVQATQHLLVLPPDGDPTVPDGTAQRPGTPAARRDTCLYADCSGDGTGQVVHLTAARPPSAAALAAWCPSWSDPTSRPTDLCG